MRSSDLLFGLFAAIAGFGAVVALASDMNGAVPMVMLFAAVVALIAMVSRADAAPQVLVVGRRDGRRLNLLESELDSGGFAVATCPGPTAGRPCPVLSGDPCDIPAHPNATIAYLGAPGEAVPPCERYFHVPTVTIDAGPRTNHTGAARQVGWNDGTRAALTAVREVTHR